MVERQWWQWRQRRKRRGGGKKKKRDDDDGDDDDYYYFIVSGLLNNLSISLKQCKSPLQQPKIAITTAACHEVPAKLGLLTASAILMLIGLRTSMIKDISHFTCRKYKGIKAVTYELTVSVRK